MYPPVSSGLKCFDQINTSDCPVIDPKGLKFIYLYCFGVKILGAPISIKNISKIRLDPGKTIKFKIF